MIGASAMAYQWRESGQGQIKNVAILSGASRATIVNDKLKYFSHTQYLLKDMIEAQFK